MVERIPFKSSSSSAVYEVQVDRAQGRATCNCPGWRFSGAARGCKHTKKVLADVAVGKPEVSQPVTPVNPVQPMSTPVTVARPNPMLATAMTKRAAGENPDVFLRRMLALYPSPTWWLEPKYDGERKMVRKTGTLLDCWSRPGAGKEANTYELPPHIAEAFLKLPDGLYDGEIYVPRGTSSDASRLDRQHELLFVIFDVLEVHGQSLTGLPYLERREAVLLAVRHYTDHSDWNVLHAAPQLEVSLKAVQEIWAADGEGAILKRATSTYTHDRSPEWVKVKKDGFETVTITGFERGKADSSTPWSVTLFKRDNGVTGRCSTLDNATVRQVEANPAAFIGARLVISYTEIMPSGKFRHGGWDHLAGEGE